MTKKTNLIDIFSHQILPYLIDLSPINLHFGKIIHRHEFNKGWKIYMVIKVKKISTTTKVYVLRIS